MGLSHSPSIVTNGLVLCLDAANKKSYPGSGNIWYDISGRSNHGTITGGVTYVSNASQSYFNFPTASDNNYIYSSTPQDYQDVFIGFYPDFTLSAAIVGLIGTSAPAASLDDSLRFIGANGVGPWTLSGRNPGDANDWASGTASNYRINGLPGETLVNGWNLLSGYRTNRSWSAGNSWNYYLGSSAYPGRSFQGKIALVLMYNRALTTNETLQNFAAFRGRFGL